MYRVERETINKRTEDGPDEYKSSSQTLRPVSVAVVTILRLLVFLFYNQCRNVRHQKRIIPCGLPVGLLFIVVVFTGLVRCVRLAFVSHSKIKIEEQLSSKWQKLHMCV